MDVLCELYPVEMTAIFASKRIFAAAATGGARTAELPTNMNMLSFLLLNISEMVHVCNLILPICRHNSCS